MEEIIAKHPEIIENGLILKGCQVYVSGLRIDLLFEDKFGDRLIIELKKRNCDKKSCRPVSARLLTKNNNTGGKKR